MASGITKRKKASIPKGSASSDSRYVEFFGNLFNKVGGIGFVLVCSAVLLFTRDSTLKDSFFKKWMLLEGDHDGAQSTIIIIFLVIGWTASLLIYQARFNMMQKRIEEMAEEKKIHQEILTERQLESSKTR